MSADARSRLCPEHRSDPIPTSSCGACAHARRIAELGQTVERLVVCIGELESGDEDTTEKTTQIPLPQTDSP